MAAYQSNVTSHQTINKTHSELQRKTSPQQTENDEHSDCEGINTIMEYYRGIMLECQIPSDNTRVWCVYVSAQLVS